MKRLIVEYPNYLGFSVSHTTRLPRPGEMDGVDYHFVSEQQFEKWVQVRRDLWLSVCDAKGKVAKGEGVRS